MLGVRSPVLADYLLRYSLTLYFARNFEKELSVFDELSPYDRLAILIDGNIIRAVPNVREYYSRYGKVIAVETSSEEVLNQLGGIDAVYLFPTPRLQQYEKEKLFKGLIGKKLPLTI